MPKRKKSIGATFPDFLMPLERFFLFFIFVCCGGLSYLVLCVSSYRYDGGQGLGPESGHDVHWYIYIYIHTYIYIHVYIYIYILHE